MTAKACKHYAYEEHDLVGAMYAAQPHGLSPAANVVKECGEEAGIPPQLAAQARPVGAVSYAALQPAGIKRDVLFCYDLCLPEDFVPAPQVPGALLSCLLFSLFVYEWKVLICSCQEMNPALAYYPSPPGQAEVADVCHQDGEVESFQRLPVAEVADIIQHSDSFKDNCNLVIIDFLIRHGHLQPEQAGYLELLSGLRAGDCT